MATATSRASTPSAFVEPDLDQDEAHDHPRTHQHVAKGVARIGFEDLAAQPAALPVLPGGHSEVHGERGYHHRERADAHSGFTLALEAVHRAAGDGVAGDPQHHGDGRGCEGLELAVSVGMTLIRGSGGEPHADEPHDVRGSVKEGAYSVGLHGHRVTEESVQQLGQGDGDVEGKNHPQHAPDAAPPPLRNDYLGCGSPSRRCRPRAPGS